MFRGKVCAVTGIRAAESLVRYRSAVNKLNENYITASGSGLKGHDAARPGAPSVMLGKPIYDWQENDVLRYIWENELRYAPAYDHQHLIGQALRVSTPLHAESARHFGKLRQTEPEFYAQLIDLFPDMQLHERYWGELDREALERRYGQSLAGVRQYILDRITDPKLQPLALERLDLIVTMARRQPEIWPPYYVLSQFINGSFKRVIQPIQVANQRKKVVA